jgi:hypothetical protein
MTARCVADFTCLKNQSVRFLISIQHCCAPYAGAAGNKGRRRLYLQRSFLEIFGGVRGCAKKMGAREDWEPT